MPPAPRPSVRRVPATPLVVLAVSFTVFLLAFLPNPLTDKLVSWAVGSAVSRPVHFKRVQYEFPFGASFLEAVVGDASRGPLAVARQGRLRLDPSQRQWTLRVHEIDLEPLYGPSSSTGSFIRRTGLSEWLLIRDSLWLANQDGSTSYLRLLEGQVGEGSVKGGLRMDGDRVSKVDAAFWLPESVWKRFPELVEKRFAQDEQRRRLFKLSWNNGRWTLWGRSAPVLEASWH
jgi:hypothetical protein